MAINILATSLISPLMVKAEANYTEVQNSVNLALAERNFYYYNMAFGRIMELPEGYERDVLLGKLGTITDVVWTKEIGGIVQSFHVIAKEKSGREFDSVQRVINASSMKEVDKQYLLHELSTWGRDTVWTEDYKKAIDAIIKVWALKTEVSAEEADKAVSEVKVSINKVYLNELLEEAKNAVGLGPVILDGKYFDSAINKIYTGTGKSVNLDFSKDLTSRTVTLKGDIKDLNINAPKGTVILQDANVVNVNITDISGSSLELRGTTKLQKLTVNDKDNISRVVVEGKSTVASAEIKSGTILEVKVDKEVLKPFGSLIINTLERNVLQLRGDFKDTVVKVQRPVQLTIEDIVKRIEFLKEAVNSILNTSRNTRISEVNADAVLTIDGPTGTVSTLSGAAKDTTIYKNTAGTSINTGGGGGYTPVDSTMPVITLNGDAIKEVPYAGVYTELDATANDNWDGNITGRIIKTIKNSAGEIITSINTSIPGTYTIEYSVTDNAGNKATITRTVKVLEATAKLDAWINRTVFAMKLYGNLSHTFEISGDSANWTVAITNNTIINRPLNNLFTSAVDKIAQGTIPFDKIQLLINELNVITINGDRISGVIASKLQGKPHSAAAIAFLQNPNESNYNTLVTALSNNNTYSEIVGVLNDMSLINGGKKIPALNIEGITLNKILVKQANASTVKEFEVGTIYSSSDIKAKLGLSGTVTGNITIGNLYGKSIGLQFTSAAGDKTYWINMPSN